MSSATMRQMNGMMDMLTAQFSKSIGSDPRSMIEDDRSQSKVSTYSPVRPSDLHVQTKTTRTSIKAGIALLNIQSSTTTIGYPEEDGNSKEISKPARTSFVVNFLWGFRSCRRGFRLSTNSSFDSLRLDSIRRRPSDSQIFRLCELGDTRGVQKLLMTGDASIFDADEVGRGLLHVSDLTLLLKLRNIDFKLEVCF